MKIFYWSIGAILSAIMLVAVGVMAYTSHWMRNATFFTIDTTYVDSLTYAPSETFFVEVNYYTNALNNGKRVFEVRMNQYTSVQLTGDGFTKNVWSHGLQMRGDSWFRVNHRSTSRGFFSGNRVDYWVDLTGDHSFYNSFDLGHGWQPYHLVTSPLRVQNEWLLDFAGELGAVRPRGMQRFDTTRSRNLLGTNDIFGRNDHHYWRYDVNYFLVNLRNATLSQPWGSGVVVMDLSRWFNAYSFDHNTGWFDRPWHRNDVRRMFVNVRFNVSPHGMVVAEQSMFGMVGVDRNFSYDGRQPQRYSRVTSAFTLTINDFEFLNVGGNYYLGRIRQERIDWLNTFRNLSVFIDIDLSHPALAHRTLLGLYRNPFGNLNYVDSLVFCRHNRPHEFLIYYADAMVWSELGNFWFANNITIGLWRSA